MMRLISLSSLRKFAPIMSFGLVIFLLVLSSLSSVGDLISMRSTLSAETELLLKIKDRLARQNGKTSFDPNTYLVSAPSQGIAAAELQRLVSDIFAASRADLQTKEAIPADAEGGTGKLSVAVDFELDDEHLPELLYALENATPALMIERMSLRVLSGKDNANSRRLQGTATITGAWKTPS